MIAGDRIPDMGESMSRRDEIQAGLNTVRERIEQACVSSGRDRGDVSLIVVTKTFPVTDLRLLADLGVVDVGENRHQEGAAKAAECADRSLRWHFVGSLQTNKAAAVANYADVIHSVDRPRLVDALSRGAERAGRVLDCLIQVSLDAEQTAARTTSRGAPARDRGGAAPWDTLDLAESIERAEGLRLAGMMAVAPRGGDPDRWFGQLGEIAASLRARCPAATWISAGMSGDLEAAVRHGATHVRIGSAVLGRRPESG